MTQSLVLTTLAGSPAELQVRSMAKAQRRERQRRAKAHAAQDKDKDYEDMSVVPPFPTFYIGDPGTEDLRMLVNASSMEKMLAMKSMLRMAPVEATETDSRLEATTLWSTM